MKTILFALLLLLSACDTMPKKPEPHDPVIVPQKETIVIPKSLLEKCSDLTKLENHEYTEGQTVYAVQEWALTHKTCQAKHEKLAELVKNAFNIDAQGNVMVEKVK